MENNFNPSIDTVLTYLKLGNDKQYKRLKSIVDRNIPITAYQANLGFFRRHYGKTFISRCVVASKMLELLDTKEEVCIGIDINSDIMINSSIDKDISISQDTLKLWFREYVEFLKQYFSDIKIIENRKNRLLVRFKA